MKIISIFKSPLVVLLAFTLLSGCTNPNKFSISGNVLGAEGKILKFYRLNINGEELQDSIKLSSSGSFAFDGDKLQEPTFFTLHIDNKHIALLNDSNINIKISGNYETFETKSQIANSQESIDIQILDNQLRKTIAAIEDVKLRFANTTSDTDRNGLINQVNTIITEQKNVIRDYVAKNPRSFVSYYAIHAKYDHETFVLNIDDKNDRVLYTTIATSLNIFYPKSERIKNLCNYILKTKQQERSAKLNDIMQKLPTVGYPDLNITNSNGKKIALSSFKGKVILLTFWASWSSDGVAFNKELKRVYKSYGGKGFEIYQISLDQDKDSWIKAISHDNLTWTNVCEFTFPKAYSASVYNINQLPSNFLISKSGDIIGRNLEGKLLDEKISANL